MVSSEEKLCSSIMQLFLLSAFANYAAQFIFWAKDFLFVSIPSIHIHNVTPGLYLPLFACKLLVSSHKKIIGIA